MSRYAKNVAHNMDDKTKRNSLTRECDFRDFWAMFWAMDFGPVPPFL